jgi:hypothetical protein
MTFRLQDWDYCDRQQSSGGSNSGSNSGGNTMSPTKLPGGLCAVGNGMSTLTVTCQNQGSTIMVNGNSHPIATSCLCCDNQRASSTISSGGGCYRFCSGPAVYFGQDFICADPKLIASDDGSSDPCDGVSCDGHGRCTSGSCSCDSGYQNSGPQSCFA